MDHPKTLAEAGFSMHDIVIFDDVQKSTGGIIYKIVEDVSPSNVATTSKKVKRHVTVYDSKAHRYVRTGETRDDTEYGCFDKDGKKLLDSAQYGYVRVKPVFDLFATSKGKNPIGKQGTIILQYSELKRDVKHISITDLGAKYIEFGNLIREIAITQGMDTKPDEKP